MIIEDPLVVEKINAHLPGQIRVWGYLETQGSFHAKMDCDSRRYEFLLPTYTLMPMAQWLGAPPGATRHAAKSTFRASRSSLDAFSQAMRLFLGTHRFHNYTIRVKEHTNMSLKRYIKAIDVSDPIILQNGMEWVRIRLHGQSFMLHQIRKMIAMAILVTRSETSLCAIEQSLQADTCFNIPKAPALGLLLDRPVFDWYNQKIDSARRQPLDFDKHKDQMEAFKEQWIDQQIIQTEMDEGTFELFLDQFDAHRDHFTYLNILDRINELAHGVAGLTHIERPLLEQRLAVDKFKVERAPTDTALKEATTKCSLEQEKKRSEQGLVKAKDLAKEAQEKVDALDVQMRDLEDGMEKKEVDYRTLCKYREDLSALLDDALAGHELSNVAHDLQNKVDQSKEDLGQVDKDTNSLNDVRKLIKTADMSLLEAILELRTSNKENSLGPGQVYFPQEAFDALKKAREVYPRLPSIKPPTEFQDVADDTGAFYSPMQRYLWDVRRQLAKLIDWCDNQVIELMESKSEREIALNEATDNWNVERRQLALTLA
ncbi:pseudouridine synthase [Gongronella butleri]|nr:pseudouridine synthase [Gongronella butleri]